MRLEYLAVRNVLAKPINLTINLLLLVLSISLVTFVLQLSAQINGQLNKNIAPLDMVVGAKGSPLQLVLSSVLHIDAPTGNIKLQEAEQIIKHPFVGSAIPVSYGDNYKGYRVLGTELDYFDSYQAELAEGRFFTQPFEVVAGSMVAKKLNLKLGDIFVSSHGLVAVGGELHNDKPFTVVGILEPTGTVVDKLLVANLESVWEAHDHEEEDHHEEDHHQEDLEITSLLVKFKSPLGLVQLPRFVNENTNMQAALPRYEIQRLSGLLGTGVKTINSIAFGILLVSGLSILLSLAKTIRERRQELALLRTYGLGTKKLLYVILVEGMFLAVFGFLLGWLLGRLSLFLASGYIESSYGYALEINGPQWIDFQLFGATLFIALIAIFLASTPIFRLNISKTLVDD